MRTSNKVKGTRIDLLEFQVAFIELWVLGFEVSGFEVSGFEVSGFEVFGSEVFGFKVFSLEVFGFEVFSFEIFGFEDFDFEVLGFEVFDFKGNDFKELFLKTKRNFKEVQGTQKTSFTMSKAQPKSLTLEQIKNKKPGFLFFKALNESGVGLDCQRFLTVKIDLGPKGFSFLFALHKAGVKGPPALPFLMYRVCWRALKVNFWRTILFDENWGQFISIFYLGDTLSIFRKPLKALI